MVAEAVADHEIGEIWNLELNATAVPCCVTDMTGRSRYPVSELVRVRVPSEKGLNRMICKIGSVDTSWVAKEVTKDVAALLPNNTAQL